MSKRLGGLQVSKGFPEFPPGLSILLAMAALSTLLLHLTLLVECAETSTLTVQAGPEGCARKG